MARITEIDEPEGLPEDEKGKWRYVKAHSSIRAPGALAHLEALPTARIEVVAGGFRVWARSCDRPRRA